MKAKVIGDHIAIKRVKETKPEGKVGGFVYSGKDNDDMVIYTGEVMGFGDLCEGIIKVGQTAYYNKSRSYVIRLLDGEEYTMIKLNAVVAVE